MESWQYFMLEIEKQGLASRVCNPKNMDAINDIGSMIVHMMTGGVGNRESGMEEKRLIYLHLL